MDISYPGWQAIPYRANLLWVDDHKHGKYTHLAIKLDDQSAIITGDDVRRYRRMVDESPALAKNPAMAEQMAKGKDGKKPRGKNYYRNVERLTGKTEDGEVSLARNVKEDLKLLSKGTFLFGLEDPNATGRLACFGKSVHFVWPSLYSPGSLAHWFWDDREWRGIEEPSRGEEVEDDEGEFVPADTAEMAFGFAAPHEPRNGSHPFRGRLRFETFWADKNAKPMDKAVQLGPLTSPTGQKLKARPLYLPPAANGRAATYDEAKSLRGRKFYWHQRGSKNGIIDSHLRKDTDAADQCPLPVHPLPAGTEFSGAIHFDNLTLAELGALVATVSPGHVWKENPANTLGYGWKIGKGKPRGLGSLQVKSLVLKTRKSAKQAYSSLGRDVLSDESGQLDKAVDKLKEWLVEDHFGAGITVAGGDWRQLPFAKDLERLLRIPESESVRSYPEMEEYAWMPGFGDRLGIPSDGRPPAMNLARDIDVP